MFFLLCALGLRQLVRQWLAFHGCVCVCERVARTRGDDYQVGVSWLCVCERVARTRGDDYQVGVSWLCVCV